MFDVVDDVEGGSDLGAISSIDLPVMVAMFSEFSEFLEFLEFSQSRARASTRSSAHPAPCQA